MNIQLALNTPENRKQFMSVYKRRKWNYLTYYESKVNVNDKLLNFIKNPYQSLYKA